MRGCHGNCQRRLGQARSFDSGKACRAYLCCKPGALIFEGRTRVFPGVRDPQQRELFEQRMCGESENARFHAAAFAGVERIARLSQTGILRVPRGRGAAHSEARGQPVEEGWSVNRDDFGLCRGRTCSGRLPRRELRAHLTFYCGPSGGQQVVGRGN